MQQLNGSTHIIKMNVTEMNSKRKNRTETLEEQCKSRIVVIFLLTYYCNAYLSVLLKYTCCFILFFIIVVVVKFVTTCNEHV